MNVYRIIQNLYLEIGLTNYRLKDTQDLLEIYDLDFKEVKGFNELNDINKNSYKKFIIGFFNGWGLESRMELIPTRIYQVEHIRYLGEELNDDCLTLIGETINKMNRLGAKSVIDKWIDKSKKIYKSERSTYLRFEYTRSGNKQWLHVTKSGTEWY